MPPRIALSSPLRSWTCPQCRSIASSSRLMAVGPEHPRYIEIPEPPQQSLPYRPFVKGRLPVPRDIFKGSRGKDRADDEQIVKTAPSPARQVSHPRGSRDAWRQKMADARRENLREGLKGLRDRKTRIEVRLNARSAASALAREEGLRQPEREDERLTTPSTGLDVQKLLKGPLEDPNRAARLDHKARNLELHTSARRANRMDQLHTLYMNARGFIVTPQQLDAAIDKEFGTPNKPREFGQRFNSSPYGYDDAGRWSSEVTSMWANGAPLNVREMLNEGRKRSGEDDTSLMSSNKNLTKAEERVKRIAEKLTGGKMAE